jgi:hypothetical protein
MWIRRGDVVWFSPGEKHWHGARAKTAMTHTAIQEKKDGKVVDWMEKVSDEQYNRTLLNRSPFALCPAAAGGNDQRLPQWMRVPRRLHMALCSAARHPQQFCSGPI